MQPTFPDDLDVAANADSHPISFPHNIQFHPHYDESTSRASSAIQSLTSASTLDSKLELLPVEGAARHGVLQESYFPSWKNDSEPIDESPEEMAKKDPLATQVWRLYSKAKSQLPNAERMENLTWRMMSMNLRRLELERERTRGCVPPPTRRF